MVEDFPDKITQMYLIGVEYRLISEYKYVKIEE
jgi:hypothetical protein